MGEVSGSDKGRWQRAFPVTAARTGQKADVGAGSHIWHSKGPWQVLHKGFYALRQNLRLNQGSSRESRETAGSCGQGLAQHSIAKSLKHFQQLSNVLSVMKASQAGFEFPIGLRSAKGGILFHGLWTYPQISPTCSTSFQGIRSSPLHWGRRHFLGTEQRCAHKHLWVTTLRLMYQ